MGRSRTWMRAAFVRAGDAPDGATACRVFRFTTTPFAIREGRSRMRTDVVNHTKTQSLISPISLP
jgi:hypothetical protein